MSCRAFFYTKHVSTEGLSAILILKISNEAFGLLSEFFEV